MPSSLRANTQMLDRLRHATDVTKFKAAQLLRVNRVQGEIANIRRKVQLARDRIAAAALELHRVGSPLPSVVSKGRISHQGQTFASIERAEIALVISRG